MTLTEHPEGREAPKLRVRTAAVSGTGRTSFRFDDSTWAAIDMVAARANMPWAEWAKRAVESRPNTGSKAAAVRAALADAMMAEQFLANAEERAAGLTNAPQHPIVGGGYYRLDDKTLAVELDGAEFTHRDDSFEGFTFISGYRDKSFGGSPFICVENRLKGGLHLFIVKEGG